MSEADAQALRRVGVPQEQIEAQHLAQRQAAAAEPPMRLWAWHQDAYRLYCAMRTQWRVVAAPTGHLVHTGLDYGPLDSVQRRIGLGHRMRCEELLGQLQTIERSVRDILNKR